MKKKKFTAAKTLVTAIIAAASILGAYAAFTAVTDVKENTFSIVAGESGEEAGEIQEPNWDPEKAKDLVPSEEVPKDPQVQSNVDYESWVFLTVEIPAITATLDEIEAVYDAVTANFDTDNWTLIQSEKASAAGESSSYTYGYNKKVAAHGSTTALFTNITVPDFTKVSEKVESSVRVYGKMIQTVGNATLDDAAQALKLK